ncbi:hypothetical protein SDJN03_09855, partial [Cucurbita argyrosperma subsp. sororia]
MTTTCRVNATLHRLTFRHCSHLIFLLNPPRTTPFLLGFAYFDLRYEDWNSDRFVWKCISELQAAGTGGSGGNGSVINDTSALTSVDDSNPNVNQVINSIQKTMVIH